MTKFSELLKFGKDHIPCGKIIKESLTKDDPGYSMTSYVALFMNQGQTLCWIDEQIPLEPGGIMIERNLCRDYSFQFFPMLVPPAVNKPLVFAGNRLAIRKYVNSPFVDVDYIKNPGTVNATVSSAPFISEPVVEFEQEVNTNFSIPAGQLTVEIYNAGYEGSDFSPTLPTVNGSPLSVGKPIKFFVIQDTVNNKLKTSPAYTVVANNHKIWYKYSN